MASRAKIPEPEYALQSAATALQLLADSLSVHGEACDEYAPDIADVLQALGLCGRSAFGAAEPKAAQAEPDENAMLQQTVLHAQQLTFTKDVYEKRLRILEEDLERARAAGGRDLQVPPRPLLAQMSWQERRAALLAARKGGPACSDASDDDDDSFSSSEATESARSIGLNKLAPVGPPPPNVRWGRWPTAPAPDTRTQAAVGFMPTPRRARR